MPSPKEHVSSRRTPGEKTSSKDRAGLNSLSKTRAFHSRPKIATHVPLTDTQQPLPEQNCVHSPLLNHSSASYRLAVAFTRRAADTQQSARAVRLDHVIVASHQRRDRTWNMMKNRRRSHPV